MFFSKMHQDVVTIRSECTEEGDDCNPKLLVDLIKDKEIYKILRVIKLIQFPCIYLILLIIML